jgi:hypothetical protein
MQVVRPDRAESQSRYSGTGTGNTQIFYEYRSSYYFFYLLVIKIENNRYSANQICQIRGLTSVNFHSKVRVYSDEQVQVRSTGTVKQN